jgi:hypothetical protein
MPLIKTTFHGHEDGAFLLAEMRNPVSGEHMAWLIHNWVDKLSMLENHRSVVKDLANCLGYHGQLTYEGHGACYTWVVT